MRKMLFALVAVGLAATPAAAQDHDDDHMSGSSGPMADMKPLQDQFMGWVLTAAEQMPQEKYSYAPTEEVRTFGQLIGHIVGANFTFCSTALGEESPVSGDLEAISDKAEMVAVTRQAIEYCARAYTMPHGMAHDERSLFGRSGSLTWLLAWNLAHNAEHYGNLVTYLRINGMVPPSSQRG